MNKEKEQIVDEAWERIQDALLPYAMSMPVSMVNGSVRHRLVSLDMTTGEARFETVVLVKGDLPMIQCEVGFNKEDHGR